jgi:hypothetical protein
MFESISTVTIRKYEHGVHGSFTIGGTTFTSRRCETTHGARLVLSSVDCKPCYLSLNSQYSFPSGWKVNLLTLTFCLRTSCCIASTEYLQEQHHQRFSMFQFSTLLVPQRVSVFTYNASPSGSLRLKFSSRSDVNNPMTTMNNLSCYSFHLQHLVALFITVSAVQTLFLEPQLEKPRPTAAPMQRSNSTIKD